MWRTLICTTFVVLLLLSSTKVVVESFSAPSHLASSNSLSLSNIVQVTALTKQWSTTASAHRMTLRTSNTNDGDDGDDDDDDDRYDDVFSVDCIPTVGCVIGEDDDDDDNATPMTTTVVGTLQQPHRRFRNILPSSIKRRTKPVILAILTALSATFLPGSIGSSRPRFNNFVPVARAAASTPIVLRAAQKKEDPPMVQAMKKADELKKKNSLEEFDKFMATANNIEVDQGKAARSAYEKQYHIDKSIADAQKQRDILQLKRTLLDSGMDPNTDLDAERQVFLLEYGIDLEKISGTPHNEKMIKNFQKRRFGKVDDNNYQIHQRYIVQCQVADLKARGIDPMNHFANTDVMSKTRAIYRLDNKVAEKIAKQYQGLMAEYGGRLTPRKEGEVPFVYPDISDSITSSVASISAAATAEAVGGSAKELKAAAKAKRIAEATALRLEKLETRARLKAEKLAGKAKAASDRAIAKDRKMAEKMASLSTTAATGNDKSASSLPDVVSTLIVEDGITDEGITQLVTSASADGNIVAVRKPKEEEHTLSNIITTIKSKATVTNIGTVLVAGGVASYGFNYLKENNPTAKNERERQLRLILGNVDDDDEDEDDDEYDDDEDDVDMDELNQQQQSKPKLNDIPPPTKVPPIIASSLPPPPPAPPVPKPKRTLGIFSKRNADARPTDLNVLISPTAQAPELATLLAQILTFGAPGRFPKVKAWKRNMPFDVYDGEMAKTLLVESRNDAKLTDEQAAEIFASVVNCMIIDIVDLASSTLKVEKKKTKKDDDDDNTHSSEKITVDAINVVMDFMDHAASLFDSVSKDISIKPVVYGGTLRKKDLEQMYSIYAGSSMLAMDGSGGTTQDRVDTLQLVFGITDKKAEGLMQKHMMKMVMNLMKDGGKGMEGMPGMEGMEEMMKAMGGGGGMPGMDGGEMSPEDLKQTLGMMRDMMESGQVSKEELGEVRKQFREMYGSDISDLIKKASEEGAAEEMTDDERELLDLFKQILGDD